MPVKRVLLPALLRTEGWTTKAVAVYDEPVVARKRQKAHKIAFNPILLLLLLLLLELVLARGIE
jgi:hypothetical protein